MISLPAPAPFILLPAAVVLGLIFGSFVTALSYRLPRGQSIATGRSACPACGTKLTARDLVPVFSWLAHGGKCRHCGTRVSRRYPAIEIVMALLFAAATLLVHDIARLALVLAVTPVMVALAIIDVEHSRLPNSLLVTLAGLFLALRYIGDRDFTTALVVAVIVFALAVALDFVGRRLIHQGLGMGDAKLMAVAALVLPPMPLFAALGGAGLLGAGVAVLPWVRKKAHRGHFPFGPALLAAIWMALVTL
jgi:prepilin signal peptidase PulO-like enzyme (type II secretory pathway)